MPQDRKTYPFYFQVKDDTKTINIDLTEDEEKIRRQDSEVIKQFKDYHKNFQQFWTKGGSMYNVIQQGTPDDRVSNWYLGLSRIIIDQGIAMMSQGEPEFDFDPIGPSDHKKIIIWKALIKYILNKCNWKAHQDKWITDMHVFGSSPIEVYTDIPQRLRRYERPDGSIEQKIMRDFRRAKVGMRHRSIWHTYRNNNILDPDEVPSGGYTENLTRNQFVQNYMNVFLPNGKNKYKNLDQVPAASHYQVEVFFDEITDAYRIYALPYGSQADGKPLAKPEGELGVPIFDKPLCIYHHEIDGQRVSGGANVPGMVPLCFGNFNDQLDIDYMSHSVYGMGIPQLIEGPESIFQAMMNMTVDNMRLKNTVVIGYEGNDLKTAMDLDNVTYYSGQFVDGKINPQSMGIADITSNQVLWEWLNNICIWVTGINFQQIGGDQAKTAFEFAQRIRENNQRAKHRIEAIENGPLKRAGLLLLANSLSETTVPEWEALTEQQAKDIAIKISEGEMTGEDYQKAEGGEPAKKRVQFNIPVPGKKYREDFKGKSKKRKLDYTSTDNTLIEDPNLPGDVSYVPAVDTYLLPSGMIESILQFNVRVDGSGMLGDERVKDIQTAQQIWGMLMQGMAPGPDQKPILEGVDPLKVFTRIIEDEGWDESDVMKDDEKGSKMMESVKKAIAALQQPSPSPNAQVPVSMSGQATAQPGASGQSPNLSGGGLPAQSQVPTGNLGALSATARGAA